MHMPILRRALPCLSLTLLLGCDVWPIPLKPDVPEENLSQFKYEGKDLSAQNLSHWLKYGFWLGRVSQQGIALEITGSIIPPYYGGKKYDLLFPTKITNTRAHPIRLTRNDLAVSMDGEPPVRDSIDLFQVKLKQGENRTVSTPTPSVNEITIDSNGTALVDIRLRDDRLGDYEFLQSATLYLAAFHDIETGETIPFTIRFQKVK